MKLTLNDAGAMAKLEALDLKLIIEGAGKRVEVTADRTVEEVVAALAEGKTSSTEHAATQDGPSPYTVQTVGALRLLHFANRADLPMDHTDIIEAIRLGREERLDMI